MKIVAPITPHVLPQISLTLSAGRSTVSAILKPCSQPVNRLHCYCCLAFWAPAREALRVGDAMKRFAPCAFMRRGNEDAINVEDGGDKSLTIRTYHDQLCRMMGCVDVMTAGPLLVTGIRGG